jgi:hypothetical protein
MFYDKCMLHVVRAGACRTLHGMCRRTQIAAAVPPHTPHALPAAPPMARRSHRQGPIPLHLWSVLEYNKYFRYSK